MLTVYATPDRDGEEFEYQTFGIWSHSTVPGDPAAPTRLGAYSIGAQTPEGALPDGFSASYRGGATGYAFVDGPDGIDGPEEIALASAPAPPPGVYATFADATMGVSPGEGGLEVTFATWNTHLVDPLTEDVYYRSELELTGSGTFDGTGFDGTVTYARGCADECGGDFSGRLYGPGAEEIGGHYAVDGRPADLADFEEMEVRPPLGRVRMIGSFGGMRTIED